MNTSIQTEITNLQNTKKNNRTAILEKGVVVYATDLYSSYPTKISLISMTPGDKDSLLTSLMNETLTEFTIPDGTSVIADGTLTANNSVETLVIPNTVKEIGDGAFQSNNLRTVIIEGDFETVGNRVFYDCQMLQSVTFEEGVTSAGGNLFRECTSLTQVNLPSTLEYIDGFYGCTSLTNITIPSGVKSIGNSAFMGCSSLTSVTIPNNVTSIGGAAFAGCTSLTSITINATTPPTLGQSAFNHTNDCPIYVSEDSVQSYKTAWPDLASRIQAMPANTFALRFTPTGGGTPIEVELEDLATEGVLTRDDIPSSILNGTGSIEIGDGVTQIADGTSSTSVFLNCTGIQNVVIGNDVTRIGKYAFRGCTGLTSVTIPDSVTRIGTQAFYGCSSLTSVTIGNSVTSIGEGAFYGCSSLTSVTIGNSVTSIGNYAFKGCTGLTSVTIPSRVTSIGNSAFQNCSGLTSITCLATTPPTLGTTAFDKTNNCPIYVPDASVSRYKTANNWRTYASRIQAIPAE